MPLSSADSHRRALVKKAVDALRDGEQRELGDVVDALMTRNGRDFIKRVLDAEGGTRNLSVKIPGHLWAELAPYETAGGFARIIEEGFQSFLRGDFEVRLPQRAAKGTASAPRTLNPSLSNELQSAVSRRCRELHEEKTAGRELRVSTVAALALYRHFEIGPYTPGVEFKVKTKDKVQVYLAADRIGTILDSGLSMKELAEIVDAGLHRFLDGTFDLRLQNRPIGEKGVWDSGEKIHLFLDSDLMRETKERFAEVKKERQLHGYFGTTSVAAAVLYEHFGLAPYASDAGA